MMKRMLLAFGLCLASAPAWAACAVTNLTVKDAAGSPVTALVPYADDGSGGSNCSPQIQIKQGGNVAAVTAAGADTVSNSTGGLQGYSFPFWFNGTTWDRARGDSTNGAFVNVKTSVLPTGGATSANQSTEITALNSIVTNTAAGAGSPAASVPASAIYVGNRGQNVEQAAVTNGQLVGQAADLTGKPIVLPYANPENFLNGQITAAMTGTTTTAVTGMGAQGAGVRNYVTQCTFSNSHATVGTIILLQDGSGGTTLWQAPAAAAFGGAVVQFPTPIKTTANTGLFAQNVTTGSNTFVSCTGYKGI